MPYKAKAAIIVPAAGLVLGACSSSGGSRTATTKADAPTKSAITLGANINLSSPTGLTTYPDVLAGLNAAVLQVNANGGIQGHTVKFATFDTQTNSNTGLARLSHQHPGCRSRRLASDRLTSTAAWSVDRFRCRTLGMY
jgi:hypothetical protein